MFPLCSNNAMSPSYYPLILTNIHALGLEIFPRLDDLSLQLLVCIWDVVEGKDSPAELEEEVCAEGNEGPEGKLLHVRDDLLGEDSWQRTTGTTSFWIFAGNEMISMNTARYSYSVLVGCVRV
jgi:hypothetical protein